VRRRTNLQVAREMWEREGWGEPRDDAQRDLWVAFFLGDPCNLNSAWKPRNWTRPARWIEDLIRAPSVSVVRDHQGGNE
jgi:hypothetical protein